MNRRQYLSLGATGMVLGVAGCTDGESGQQYPPYPDSESTEFSGSGDTTTDRFELAAGGPMIVDVAYEGDGRFVAFAVDAADENFVQGGPTVQAVGPYRGSSIHSLPADEYRLEIEADGEWTATVYDLPAYDDGTGLSLPIDREGELGGVIGPIDFGSPTTKEFSVVFDAATEANWVDLVDREGAAVGSLFEGRRPELGGNDTETPETVGETETTRTFTAGGVGYLSIESGNQWTVSLTDTE